MVAQSLATSVISDRSSRERPMRPLLLALILVGTVSANDDDTHEKRSAIVDSSISSIRQELDQMDGHPWAGVYSTAPGLSGTTFLVAPNFGAAYRDWACVGTMAENSGIVKANGANLEIAWKFPSRTADPMETVFVPIKWGPLHFLVPRSEILDFCKQARSKRPLLSHFLRRDGAEELVPNGDPELPREYAHYATMDGIHARIVSVKPQKATPDPDVPQLTVVTQEVTLDVGSRDGLQPMMRLYLTEHHSNSPTRLTVHFVEENQCQANAWVWSSLDEQIVPLEKGLGYSSNSWSTMMVQLGRTKP